jgi:hypothetical protein
MLHCWTSQQWHPFSTGCYTRGWAANSPNSRIRLKADLDRDHQEIALLREELRIHHVRVAQLPPH